MTFKFPNLKAPSKYQAITVFGIILIGALLTFLAGNFLKSRTKTNRISINQAITYVDTIDFATTQTEDVSLRYDTGREYGWRIHFRTHNENIDFEIEDTINGKPEDLNWLTPEDQRNATQNGRTVMPVKMDPSWDGNGHVGMKYMMEKGDELGVHEIKVFVEGKLIQTFSFRVHED